MANLPTFKRPPFFRGDRAHLFRPLAGRSREAALACLEALYQRTHSPGAELDFRIDRNELRALFAAAIQDAPPLEAEPEEGEPVQASAMIRSLLEHGWIEEYRDSGSMRSAFRFTRTGKYLVQRLVELDQGEIRTRQRNVRNVRNALAAFAARRDPYDLIDAVDFARRVVQDIQEDVEHLEERRLALFQAAAEHASRDTLDGFLDYLENQFSPDLSIRMAADNVERHSADIRTHIEAIQRWPAEELASLDERLLPLARDLKRDDEPLTITLLFLVHQHITHAAEDMLPRLREALEAFFRRAGMLIKQATALASTLDQDRMGELFEQLKQEPESDDMLVELGQRMAYPSVRLADPERIRPRKLAERRSAEVIVESFDVTAEALLEAALKNAEEKAFALPVELVRDQLLAQMGERPAIRLSELRLRDAHAVLAAIHAIELASTSVEGERSERFEVKPLGSLFHTPYFSGEDFLIIRHNEVAR